MRFSRFALFGALVSSANASMKGVQTGPLAGSAYASNMLYDAGNAQVFLVGNTYDPNIAQDGASASQAASESSCFITSVDLDYFDQGWDWAETFGDPNVMESCHGLGLVNPTALVVLGNSEPQGLYSNEVSKLSGFAMALDKSNLDITSGSTIATSSQTRIPYPIAVATDGDKDMYIVALTSIDDQFSTTYNRATSESFPNWILSEKYGSSFDMTVAKFSFEENFVLGVPDGPSTMTNKWTQEFPVEPEANNGMPRVYIGGIIYKNDAFLVVAGSTRGLGPTYGDAVGDDEDGFLTLLNPANGLLLENQKSQSRIGSSEDDIITGICDNPNDPNSFYIVGATKGDIDGIQDDQLDIPAYSLQPFIKKVSVSTLHGIWTIQWGAIQPGGVNTETSAYALSCAVHGDTVYVAGNVENGAGMVQGYDAHTSKGGDDIWVTRITDNGRNYNIEWLNQVGTDGDDRLARYGGIVTDDDGNAVLYGDTTGSLFRDRGNNEDPISDVFVMVLDKDGDDSVIAPPADPVPNPTPSGDFEGVQSGPSIGNVYAASMVYSKEDDEVYLVGSTYDPILGASSPHAASDESSCFLAPMQLEADTSVFGHAQVYGSARVLESCRGIGFMSDDSFVMMGNSGPDGINNSGKMTGFASVIDRASLEHDGAIDFKMSDPAKIPYPVSAVSDQRSSMYVVALTSTDDQYSDQFAEVASNQFPNWIRNEKYGSSFDMSVMKVSYTESEAVGVISEGMTSLSQEWTHEFPIDPESNGVLPRVYVGGLILKNDDFLVAVGSTRGIGEGYGGAEGDDEDGFISLIDLDTGDLVQNRKNQERIGSEEDDIITGICDNPNDPNSFYVVGATKGDVDGIQDNQLTIKDNSLQAFIKKVNLDTLHGIWTVQWGALRGDLETSAYALGCAVDGDTVYVAGNVENGAGMVQGYDMQESKGGDDVWVASLTDNGHHYDVNWLHQIGTRGDESLARYGGIAVDRDGNAIIYGDTNGSMFRERGDEAGDTDVFVMKLKKETGHHAKPPAQNIDDAGVGPGDYDNELTPPPPANGALVEDEKSGKGAKSFGISLLVVLVLAGTFLLISKHQYQKACDAQKSSTFEYLQQFDVEDIDLRRSPPGGWHGTYLNKLAYGVNDTEVEGPMPEVSIDGPSPSNLTHSSIVNDSLFMERGGLFSASHEASPALGQYRDDPEGDDHPYGGLSSVSQSFDDRELRTAASREII